MRQNGPQGAYVATVRALLVALLGLSVFAKPLSAQPTPPSLDGVLSSLATEGLLEQSYGFLTEAVERQKKDKIATELEAQQLLALAKRIYLGSNLYPVFKKAYGKFIDKGDMQATFAWLATPAGIKLRQSLAAAYKAPRKEREALLAAQTEAQLGHNRKNALATYGKTWMHREFYQTLQHGADLAVLLAAHPAASGPKTAVETPLQIKKGLQSRRLLYDKSGTEFFQSFDVYLAKDVTNDDIDEWSQFANTQSGHAHILAYTKALSSTLESAALTLQAQALKPEPKKTGG